MVYTNFWYIYDQYMLWMKWHQIANATIYIEASVSTWHDLSNASRLSLCTRLGTKSNLHLTRLANLGYVGRAGPSLICWNRWGHWNATNILVLFNKMESGPVAAKPSTQCVGFLVETFNKCTSAIGFTTLPKWKVAKSVTTILPNVPTHIKTNSLFQQLVQFCLLWTKNSHLCCEMGSIRVCFDGVPFVLSIPLLNAQEQPCTTSTTMEIHSKQWWTTNITIWLGWRHMRWRKRGTGSNSGGSRHKLKERGSN